MTIEKLWYIPPTRSPPHLGHFTWCSCEQEVFLPKLTPRDSCVSLASCSNNFYTKNNATTILFKNQ